MATVPERLRWDKRYTRGHVPVTLEDAAKRIEELEAALSEAQARILDLEAVVRGLGGHIPKQERRPD